MATGCFLSSDLRVAVRSVFDPRPKAAPVAIFEPTQDPLVGMTTSYRQGTAPTLLCFIGPCSDCSKGSLKDALAIIGPKRRVTVVHSSPLTPESRRELREMGIGNLLLDSDQTLHREFNAGFLPRFFLVSPQGRLMWKQDAPSISLLAELGDVK